MLKPNFKLKKNLVISTVGDESLHKHWIDCGQYFDTFLVYYGDNKGYENESRYYQRQKGSKFHLISDAIDSLGSKIDDYDYIWLPDDDVYLEKHDLLRLFHYMENYDLDLAQPSIIGWYGVEMNLHQQGSLMRFTNWVEIMCPCFSLDALKKCQNTFKENECGWSIEGLWNIRLGHPRNKIAIIDDVVAVHTRPVFGGNTYKTDDPEKEAMAQAKEVYDKHDIGTHYSQDLQFGNPTNGEVYCSVVYSQIKKDMEFGIAKSDRFWPPCEFMKKWKPE